MQSLYSFRGKRRFVAMPNVNMRFSIVFLYIIVLLSRVLSKMLYHPLKINPDPAICSETITKLVTRFIPYEETYHTHPLFFDIFPRRTSRINYKIDYEVIRITQEVCCEGYEKIMDKCTPMCSPSCINGRCIAKNLCQCFLGHKQISPNFCEPVCPNGCINGNCTMPEFCSCFPDYWLDTDGYTCHPQCDINCKYNHGHCLEPYTCVCNYGYEESNETNICEPFCENECENGKCTSPNVCTCYEGYERDEKGRCGPACYPPCVNGTCIARNTCQFNEDFVEIKSNNVSTNVPSYSGNCSGHGTWLKELNICLCSYGWNGWDCNERSVCVYKTKGDSTLLSSVTVTNETNSTLMENYDNAPLCYQCSDSLNNETLCLAVQSDESLTIPTVGCFLSTELPCYRRPQHDAFKKSSPVTMSLIGVSIAIILIGLVAGYAILRKRKKQKEITVNIQTILLNKDEMDAALVS